MPFENCDEFVVFNRLEQVKIENVLYSVVLRKRWEYNSSCILISFPLCSGTNLRQFAQGRFWMAINPSDTKTCYSTMQYK